MAKLKVIGHRGAKGLTPENTIASFKKALEYKVDEIEFDVRVTKDGVAIIWHSAKLKTENGARLRITRHSYEELLEHEPDLLTLKQVLDFINGAVPLYIEVKFNVLTEPVVEVLSNYKFTYALGSKSQRTLTSLHRELPDVPKIVIETWSGVRAVYRAKQLGTKIISMYSYFLWFGFIAAMKRRGYQVYAYPLSNPKKAYRWHRYGLAGVVTDFPDRFTRHSTG